MKGKILVVFLVISASLWGATIYWDGDACIDSLDCSWGNPYNWSTNTVPGPGDDVIISSSYYGSPPEVDVFGVQSARSVWCDGTITFIGATAGLNVQSLIAADGSYLTSQADICDLVRITADSIYIAPSGYVRLLTRSEIDARKIVIELDSDGTGLGLEIDNFSLYDDPSPLTSQVNADTLKLLGGVAHFCHAKVYSNCIEISENEGTRPSLNLYPPKTEIYAGNIFVEGGNILTYHNSSTPETIKIFISDTLWLDEHSSISRYYPSSMSNVTVIIKEDTLAGDSLSPYIYLYGYWSPTDPFYGRIEGVNVFDFWHGTIINNGILKCNYILSSELQNFHEIAADSLSVGRMKNNGVVRPAYNWATLNCHNSIIITTMEFYNGDTSAGSPGYIYGNYCSDSSTGAVSIFVGDTFINFAGSYIYGGGDTTSIYGNVVIDTPAVMRNYGKIKGDHISIIAGNILMGDDIIGHSPITVRAFDYLYMLDSADIFNALTVDVDSVILVDSGCTLISNNISCGKMYSTRSFIASNSAFIGYGAGISGGYSRLNGSTFFLNDSLICDTLLNYGYIYIENPLCKIKTKYLFIGDSSGKTGEIRGPYGSVNIDIFATESLFISDNSLIYSDSSGSKVGNLNLQIGGGMLGRKAQIVAEKLKIQSTKSLYLSDSSLIDPKNCDISIQGNLYMSEDSRIVPDDSFEIDGIYRINTTGVLTVMDGCSLLARSISADSIFNTGTIICDSLTDNSTLTIFWESPINSSRFFINGDFYNYNITHTSYIETETLANYSIIACPNRDDSLVIEALFIHNVDSFSNIGKIYGSVVPDDWNNVHITTTSTIRNDERCEISTSFYEGYQDRGILEITFRDTFINYGEVRAGTLLVIGQPTSFVALLKNGLCKADVGSLITGYLNLTDTTIFDLGLNSMSYLTIHQGLAVYNPCSLMAYGINANRLHNYGYINAYYITGDFILNQHPGVMQIAKIILWESDTIKNIGGIISPKDTEDSLEINAGYILNSTNISNGQIFAACGTDTAGILEISASKIENHSGCIITSSSPSGDRLGGNLTIGADSIINFGYIRCGNLQTDTIDMFIMDNSSYLQGRKGKLIVNNMQLSSNSILSLFPKGKVNVHNTANISEENCFIKSETLYTNKLINRGKVISKYLSVQNKLTNYFPGEIYSLIVYADTLENMSKIYPISSPGIEIMGDLFLNYASSGTTAVRGSWEPNGSGNVKIIADSIYIAPYTKITGGGANIEKSGTAFLGADDFLFVDGIVKAYRITLNGGFEGYRIGSNAHLEFVMLECNSNSDSESEIDGDFDGIDEDLITTKSTPTKIVMHTKNLTVNISHPNQWICDELEIYSNNFNITASSTQSIYCEKASFRSMSSDGQLNFSATHAENAIYCVSDTANLISNHPIEPVEGFSYIFFPSPHIQSFTNTNDAYVSDHTEIVLSSGVSGNFYVYLTNMSTSTKQLQFFVESSRGWVSDFNGYTSNLSPWQTDSILIEYSIPTSITTSTADTVWITVLIDGDTVTNTENEKGLEIIYCNLDTEITPMNIHEQAKKEPIKNITIKTFPNPFNSSVDISISTPQDDKLVSVKIFNIKGNLVKNIPIPPYDPHNIRFTWNATDHHGLPCNSGIYLIRVETSKSSLTDKIILIK